MRTVWTVIAALAVLAAVGIGYIYSGSFNVAADSRDSAVLDWVLSTTREQSIDRRTEETTLPASLNDITTEEGFKHYHEMCEKCHGGPGLKPTELNRGLNPKPPDLHRKSADLSLAVVFWVVKHGIKMTAMPSFGKTHDDRELLPVVAFVDRLPNISESGYSSLLRKQGGKGHDQ